MNEGFMIFWMMVKENYLINFLYFCCDLSYYGFFFNGLVRKIIMEEKYCVNVGNSK